MDAGITDLALETTHVEQSGHLAYELGGYSLAISLAISQEDGSKKQERGKYVVVWQRQPSDEWRIVVDSFSSNQPP